jgi:hypothetical protein
MRLEIDHAELRLLAELLKRRLDEIGVEEHRSESWHYKGMLHEEQELLDRLQNKLQELEEKQPAAAGQ